MYVFGRKRIPWGDYEKYNLTGILESDSQVMERLENIQGACSL